MPSLRDDVLALYARRRPRAGLSLAESRRTLDALAGLPPEFWLLAEEQAGADATFEAKLREVVKLLEELVGRLTDEEGSPGKARPGNVPVEKSAGATGKSSLPLVGAKASEDRPDREVLRLAEQLGEAEGLTLSTALAEVRKRNPELNERYREQQFGPPAVAQEGVGADVILRERARARAAADGVSYSEGMRLSLAEDPKLRADYEAFRFGRSGPSAGPPVPVPPGMRLVEARADEELAERAHARQEAEGCDFSQAMRAVLAEDAALASRYHDFTCGHTALDEASYRAQAVLDASRGRERTTPAKAIALVLSEDPTLRAGVNAYFERIS